MGGYTDKQKNDWWDRVVSFRGNVYEPADNYEPPYGGAGVVQLTTQGTVVTRGPFATPRHVIHLAVGNPNFTIRPATVDVRVGCDEAGQNPAATVRLRVERIAAIASANAAATTPLTSHTLALHQGFYATCDVVLELLNKAGTVVESARLRAFPQPDSPPNNRCYLGNRGNFNVRISVSADDGLRVEAIIKQVADALSDDYELGNPYPGFRLDPPLRHLFSPIAGDFDISRIAVALTRADELSVSVHHRPLEKTAIGEPDFFDIPQGPECEGSEEQTSGEAASEKTLCTSWSRSCHVSHSVQGECFDELDLDIAGTPSSVVYVTNGNGLDSAVASVLQGKFTLGKTAAGGEPLWQNSFWYHDDEPLTLGDYTRERIEISAVIGAHWPVPLCIGNEEPIEVSFFARAIVRGERLFGFPLIPDSRYSFYTSRIVTLSQNLLTGAACSPSTLGVLYWDRDFPWGAYFWDKDRGEVIPNTLRLDLTKCELQLR